MTARIRWKRGAVFSSLCSHALVMRENTHSVCPRIVWGGKRTDAAHCDNAVAADSLRDFESAVATAASVTESFHRWKRTFPPGTKMWERNTKSHKNKWGIAKIRLPDTFCRTREKISAAHRKIWLFAMKIVAENRTRRTILRTERPRLASDDGAGGR